MTAKKAGASAKAPAKPARPLAGAAKAAADRRAAAAPSRHEHIWLDQVEGTERVRTEFRACTWPRCTARHDYGKVEV